MSFNDEVRKRRATAREAHDRELVTIASGDTRKEALAELAAWCAVRRVTFAAADLVFCVGRFAGGRDGHWVQVRRRALDERGIVWPIIGDDGSTDQR